MKRLFMIAAAMLLLSSCAVAEIRPATGMGQIGYEAVVLCEALTVRESRSTSARSVGTLTYGQVFACQNEADSWCDCFLSDAEGTGRWGWVRSDYVLIDPAWLVTEKSTPVYAWNDPSAKKVALLSKGEACPILREEDGWLLISLRGAVGWVRTETR